MKPFHLILGLALAALPSLAQSAKSPAKPTYQPEPAQWRLNLSPDLGGWVLQGRQELRIKVVDPRDPNPPKEEQSSSWSAVYGYDEGEYRERTPEEWEAERKRQEEETRQNAWRDRKLILWFNGSTTHLNIRVGHTTPYELESQNGENRLEILQPDSGQRLVRTWWATASRTRLAISQIRRQDEEWGFGNLEILEPGGTLVEPGRRSPSGGLLSWSSDYRNPTPPMGTYTLRWTGGYRGAKPFKVEVEAVLDGGTDQERRWHFERLLLPGTGAVTLGTVDVEN